MSTDADEVAWAIRSSKLIQELVTLTGRRVHAAIIPESWTDAQARRLTCAVNRVLEAGEPGLAGIERALRTGD